MNTYAIILAGGKGTRLWPLSRRSSPKQVMPHPVTGPTTLLEQTIERIVPVIPLENILIVTVRSHIKDILRSLPSFPKNNILIEEHANNTAPAIALATAEARSRDRESFIVTLNSDCFVESPRRYQQSIRKALRIAKEFPKQLILIGVPARYPDTGLGYIIPSGRRLSAIAPLYRVRRFIEKPPLKQAEQLLKNGCYWNPTIIVSQATTLWTSLQQSIPQVTRSINAIRATSSETKRIQLFSRIKGVSIDIGLLEKNRNLLVMNGGEMGWRDVGQWATVFEILSHQQKKSVVSIGAHHDYRSRQILAYNTTGYLIATVGLQHVVIIATNDVILAVDTRFAHNVKQLVDELQQQGYEQFT